MKRFSILLALLIALLYTSSAEARGVVRAPRARAAIANRVASRVAVRRGLLRRNVAVVNLNRRNNFVLAASRASIRTRLFVPFAQSLRLRDFAFVPRFNRAIVALPSYRAQVAFVAAQDPCEQQVDPIDPPVALGVSGYRRQMFAESFGGY